MTKNKQAVILYSGGTDSTCAVFLKANDFDTIHLVSYKRFGIFSAKNIDRNIVKLEQIFGKEKFIRKIIKIDKLYKLVTYDDYFKNLIRFGFFNLAVCGLCKLSMHMRTIIYCLENDIYTVFDGANKHAGFGTATDQIREVVGVISEMYAGFGIFYSSPVYDIDAPEIMTWQKKLGLQKEETKKITTGTILKDAGFFDSDNIKGSAYDRKMQARCFQQFLSNIALNSFYIEKHGVEKYKKSLEKYFTFKSRKMSSYISDYLKKKEKSKLAKYLPQ